MGHFGHLVGARACSNTSVQRTELLRPRWLAFHVLVVGLVVLFVGLGLWQLDRLGQRRERNTVLRVALAAEPFALPESELAPEFTRVVVAGRWRSGGDVYVRYPLSEDGQPGFHVLSPLDTSDGAVVVNRGWIPVDEGRDDRRDTGPPLRESRVVAISGLVRNSQRAKSEVGRTTGDPPVPTLTAVDTAQLDTLVDGGVRPQWIQLETPAGEGDPRPLPAPEITEASHLFYALQWFAFAAIAVVGWAVLARRTPTRTGAA